jgi:3-oxoacyl-[acyl-carrier protein] reductase
MNLQLADQVVWITGASGGIGRATAELFAGEGARVALQGNENLDSLRDWVAKQEWAERALIGAADLRRAEDLLASAEKIADHWGRIDICIANAGVWPADDLLLDEISEERLRDTVEVDLLGALFTARAFFHVLRRTGVRSDDRGASLLFTGSTAGRFGERGHCDYAAAKAGLVGAMRSLKNEIVELDPRGRVNLVEPGWTATRLSRPSLDRPGAITRAVRTMPLRRIATADDVAHAIVHLSSPLASRHLTGQTITVAGGMEGRTLWRDEEIDEAAIRADLE